MFPKSRFRRLRRTSALRQMAQETRLSPSDFIVPFFVVHGKKVRNPIASMPGQYQFSVDELLSETKKVVRLGIPAVILFGIPKKKNALGTEAYASNGIIQIAVRALKKKYPALIVMADLCFCEYTSHGHCGVLKGTRKTGWDVDNDETLKLIQKTALVQAQAGVDFVAPSGMMDGSVSAIRQTLDKNGFKKIGILAYSAKFASAFYGPFREAAESTPSFGDRRAYQMDSANIQEALKEIRADQSEGADMVMVKPALSYLDVIARIRPELDIPLVAYNVSGEYAMVKAAEQCGWLDGKKPSPVALEILTSIKRAGANLIISYHALEIVSALIKKKKF